MSQVVISPGGLVGQIQDGTTVLTGALQSGIAYPHSCKAGRCGSCKSRLISGKITHLPSLRFTLSEDEKAAGYFLACRALANSDLVVSWLAQAAAENDPRPFEANVVRVDALTQDIDRLEIALREPLPFQAGQFVSLKIGSCPARSYSMANLPGENRLVFYVRRMENGCASNLIHTLKPGTTVTGEGPFGGAFLQSARTGPILAVAGGSGLAPMESIVLSALSLKMRQPIHLYFGVRTQRDLFRVDHFRGLENDNPNFRFIPVSDEGNDGTHPGRVGDILGRDLPPYAGNWHAYLAGPPPMVSAITSLLETRGVAPANILADPFYAGPVLEGEVAT